MRHFSDIFLEYLEEFHWFYKLFNPAIRKFFVSKYPSAEKSHDLQAWREHRGTVGILPNYFFAATLTLFQPGGKITYAHLIEIPNQVFDCSARSDFKSLSYNEEFIKIFYDRGQKGLHIPFRLTRLLGFIRYLLRASFLLELDSKLFFIIWRANTHDILSLTAPARVTDSYSNDHILSSIFLRSFFFFSIHEDLFW